MALTPRLRIGAYGNGKVGLKAAFPGFDVNVTADDDDATRRSFNSEWSNVLKLAQVGYVASVGNTKSSVTHSLGFIPYYEIRRYSSSGKIFYDDAWHTYVGGTQGIWMSSDVDSFTLRVSVMQTAWVSDAAYLIWNRQIGT